MRNLILPVLLFISLIIESSLTTVPLVLSFLLVFYLLKRETWIFVLAFFLGLILDSLLLRTLGQTSLFFVIFLFSVELYERKFEIKTSSFVFLSSLMGSIFYLIIFGENIFPQSLAGAFLASILFKIL